MIFKLLKILPIFLLIHGCGAFKATAPARSIASVTDTQNNLIQDVEEKLNHIHLYQVIAQKQLMQFDGPPVKLKLQAIRVQVEEIEHDIVDIMQELRSEKNNKALRSKELAIIAKINEFSERSRIHAYSMGNLKSHLKIKTEKQIKITKSEIEKEIGLLSSTIKYQVFEKNIEHLSYMLESKTGQTSKRSLTAKKG